jgi:hypothetical protein
VAQPARQVLPTQQLQHCVLELRLRSMLSGGLQHLHKQCVCPVEVAAATSWTVSDTPWIMCGALASLNKYW